MKKTKLLALVSASTILLLSGCSTSNMFGVGYDSSSCEASKNGGFCGAPSSIYKYKDKIKQTQKDYQYSGYPDELYFAITREGKIAVKDDREGKWQPYENSKFQKEIESLLGMKTKTKLGVTSDSMDIPVGKDNDLSVRYSDAKKYTQTRTNVGRMIRDNGEYTRTWVAPYVDNAGDLISAHEVYSVIRNPEWVIGEKTPKRVVEASTPTPMAKKAYTGNVKYSPNQKNTIDSFLRGE